MTSTTVASGTADASTTSYTYDLDGRQVTQTDPRNNTATYNYDAAGRMTSMRDAVGNLTQYGYDAKGQRTSLTDAKNRVTTYTYDSRGRQLTTTTPDGKTVTKTYDGLGLATSVTDEENRATQYNFDAASQLTAVIDALNQRTEYTYDTAGNKLTQKDARLNTIAYQYDNLNRRARRTLPLGQFEQYTYDAVGNIASRTDFNAKTATFAYDSLNRLLSRTPDATFSAPAVTFTYNSSGQRLTMTDATGVTSYTYTNRDQLATKATPQGTLTYTYDAAGNVTSVLSSNANGTSVNYAYDQNNRLQSVTDNRTGGTTNYTYDAMNRVQSFTYPNGATHSYTYDNRDRNTILSANGTTYTQSYSFSGRQQSVAESGGRNISYGYDSIYRLLGENITGAPSNGLLNYTLDPVGNRLSLTSTLAALQSQTANYDANDHISGDTFDSNGNTLTSNGVTYSYDFEDRLLSTSTGVQIIYDGDGNRAAETVGGVTTKFLVDGLTPTGYAQVAEEIVGTVSARYTYGMRPISQSRSSAVSYYGYDSGGSVRQLFDNTGAVTDTYAYDGFGNTIARTGTTVNAYQYRGEQFDAALGMYYLRARYYMPRTGRLITQDKYEEAPVPQYGNDELRQIIQQLDSGPGPLRGTCGVCALCSTCGTSERFYGRSLSSYSYAANDPINRMDPSGRHAIADDALLIGTFVVGAATIIYEQQTHALGHLIVFAVHKVDCLLQYLADLASCEHPLLTAEEKAECRRFAKERYDLCRAPTPGPVN